MSLNKENLTTKHNSICSGNLLEDGKKKSHFTDMQPRVLLPSFKKCADGDIFNSFNEEDIGTNRDHSFSDILYE